MGLAADYCYAVCSRALEYLILAIIADVCVHSLGMVSAVVQQLHACHMLHPFMADCPA